MNRDNYLKEGQIPDHLRPDPPLTIPPLPEYLKGNSIMSPDLRFGECWYVKLPGATALIEVVINEVTSKTVVLSPTEKYNPTLRYKKSDIEFVEKVEETL